MIDTITEAMNAINEEIANFLDMNATNINFIAIIASVVVVVGVFWWWSIRKAKNPKKRKSGKK